MEIIIRNAKREEAEILAQIERECFPEAEAATEKGYCGTDGRVPGLLFRGRGRRKGGWIY